MNLNAAQKQRAAMRHLAFSLERSVRQMALCDGVEKHVVFISLQDFSLWTAPSAATTRETIEIVTQHYPERVGHCVLYKAPAVFTAFWKVARRLLDPVTAAKITFISGDTAVGSDNDKTLGVIMGDNWRELTRQDDPAFEEGGSRGYRHTESWAKAVREEAEWRQSMSPAVSS